MAERNLCFHYLHALRLRDSKSLNICFMAMLEHLAHARALRGVYKTCNVAGLGQILGLC